MRARDADGAAILADICDPRNLADDGLRLVYADWLEDRGEPERAEFIRAQVRGLPAEARAGWVPPAFGAGLAAAGDAVALAAPACLVRFRRGLVAEVRLPLAAWLRLGPALLRAAPLEDVRVSDRWPRFAAGLWSWRRGWAAPRHDGLPRRVFRLLPRPAFASPGEAHAALNAACLRLYRPR